MKAKAINLQPLADKIHDCIINCYAAILNYARRDYDLVFLDGWYFKIYDDTQIERGAFGCVDYTRTRANIEKYYRIQIMHWDKQEVEKSVALIEENLEAGKPVAFYINARHCSWTPLWNKDDAPHYILITGIGNNELYCVDSYYSGRQETILLDDFRKSCGKSFGYECLPEIEGLDYELALQDYLAREKEVGKALYTNIKLLGEKLDIKKLKTEQAKYVSFEAFPFFRGLSFVENGRSNFLKLLRTVHLRSKNDSLLPTAAELEKIIESWDNIKFMLIKALLMSKNEELVARIRKKIHETADQEQEAYNKLQEMYG